MQQLFLSTQSSSINQSVPHGANVGMQQSQYSQNNSPVNFNSYLETLKDSVMSEDGRGLQDTFNALVQELNHSGDSGGAGISLDDVDLNHLQNFLTENPELLAQLQEFLEGQGFSTESISLGDNLPPVVLNNTGSGTSQANSNGELETLVLGIKNAIEQNVLESASILENVKSVEGATNLGGMVSPSVSNASLVSTFSTMPKERGGENSARYTQTGSNVNTQNMNTGASNLNSAASTIAPSTGVDTAFNPQQTGLQSEADVQFKAAFETLKQANSGDLLESNLNVDRSDATKIQFSDIQAKSQSSGLKQYATSVDVPVDDPEWGDKMGQKIVWLTGRTIQSAEIHLNPADLGPIDVKINIQNDQAVVTFHAQNSNVRELLESNVQRLRDMMESNGVDLTEVTVGSGESQSQYSKNNNGQDEHQDENLAQDDQQATEQGEGEVTQLVNVSERIVDFYA